MLSLLAIIAVPLLANHRNVSPEELITVNVKLHYVTEIDFVGSKDVAIVSNGDARPHYGDPKFWEVTVDRNALFIRPQDDQPPIGGGRFTNITITLSDRRRFQIHAQEVSLDKHSQPDLKLIAELDDIEEQKQGFLQMDEHLTRLVALQSESLALLHKLPESLKPAIPTGLQSPEVETLNNLKFFDYEIYDIKGKGSNFRALLLHDNRFTLIPIDGLEVPTVSALRREKDHRFSKEKDRYVKVQSTWVQNRWEMPLVDEGMVQIGKDSFKFRLRSKR